MPQLTRLLRPLRLLRTPWQPRRHEQTPTGELLLETGDAYLLERSPDAAGQPEYIRLEP